ncbi:Glycoside Hydrolase Family 71 protein [Trametes cinnabarina]|uniref:Glycoside Hydrolase Family 71 protein n=1 Tax=Pycnoporus cinnabarinus TaxID=5643 RepID=A0A060S9X8_PYCCI|nr:Glycoside Hydrolase Family 71 protein [Trametes cinnabarina]
MADQRPIAFSRFGQHGPLSLGKAALYSLMFSSRLGTGLSGVAADESVMEKLLHDVEHVLGIVPSSSGSVTSSSSSVLSSTQDVSLSVASSTAASFTTLHSSSVVASSAASPSAPNVDQVASSVSLVTATSTPLPTPSAVVQNTTGASGNATQTPAVFAHVIVGNTYNYTVSNWSKGHPYTSRACISPTKSFTDISLAASKGIDAFALNVGADSWEPSQVANAYAAAGLYNANRPQPDAVGANGTNNSAAALNPFKLFLSFDMGSLPCANASDARLLQTYIKTLNAGWSAAVKPANASLPSVWFVPSFFVDPSTFSGLSVIDGAFHWNSAWPMGNYNVTFAPDLSYINALGNKTYMASVAPWFFTHYGPNSYNKNFIYRGDDWLFAQRWEMLVQNRTRVPLAQVLTWNDFGESHYLGPVAGVQPQSQAWVDGFDHQPWLDLMQHYVAAYKTGSYPPVAKDRPIHLPNDPADTLIGTRAQTQDYLWAVALLTAPANVTLSCGSSSQTTRVPAGLSKLKLRLSADCAVKALVTRNATAALAFSPAGFSFTTRPRSYNYNAFVAASPA